MSGGNRPVAFLLLAAALVFFLNLGGPCLWDEDEPRNAGCAAEMLDRGDWVIPYFNGQVRTHKPVLLYWFMMSAYGIMGVTEFSARFWSAALGVATVLLTYGIGRRLYDARTGLLAGGILSTTVMFTVAARAATPDSVLIFFITASLAVYVAYTPCFRSQVELSIDVDRSYFPTDRRAIIAMYALMGFATLAKGPIGFLLPCASIGMFLLLVRVKLPKSGTPGKLGIAAKLFRDVIAVFHPLHFVKTVVLMRPVLLVLGVLAVALPWYALVTVRSEGVWTRGFFLEHNFGRAVNSMENHGGPPFYYIIALMFGFFPWSIFFLPFLLDLTRSLRSETLFRRQNVFVACWVGVIVGLFSLAGTKLPSYVTPCYPALALLMGRFLSRLASRRALVGTFWPAVSYSVLAAVGILAAVLIGFVATGFVPDVEPLAGIGILLLLGAVGCLWLWWRDQSWRMIQLTFACAFAFIVLLSSWGAHEVAKRQEVDELLGVVRASRSGQSIAALGTLRSSWVFYAGEPIEYLPSGDVSKAASFLSAPGSPLLLVKESLFHEIRDRLPSEATILDSVPFFLEKDRLLLVGRGSGKEVARARHDRSLR